MQASSAVGPTRAPPAAEGNAPALPVLEETNGSTTLPNAEKNVATEVSGTTTDSHTTPIPPKDSLDEDFITITHTTTFAGTTTTTTKRVPRNSAEAKLFLRTQADPPGSTPGKPPLRRPKKRSSVFDTTATKVQPVKLNCIEKSKMDWAGFVDREGIAEDLEGQSKAKEGYHARMEFLRGVEEKREAAARKK